MSVTRRYPVRPILAVSVVIFRDARVLLVKRKRQPAAGKWAFPGGAVELGETLKEAALREVQEEAGLSPHIEGVFDVLDDIHLDSSGKVEYHYVLVEMTASYVRGAVRINDESSEFGWFTPAQVLLLEATRGTRSWAKKFEARKSSLGRRTS